MPVSYETVPGGRYITDGRIDSGTGKRMGGCVRDGTGKILKEFDVDQENTGLPATLTVAPGSITPQPLVQGIQVIPSDE